MFAGQWMLKAVHRIARKHGVGLLVYSESLVMVYSQLLDMPSINRTEELSWNNGNTFVPWNAGGKHRQTI